MKAHYVLVIGNDEGTSIYKTYSKLHEGEHAYSVFYSRIQDKTYSGWKDGQTHGKDIRLYLVMSENEGLATDVFVKYGRKLILDSSEAVGPEFEIKRRKFS